VPKKHNLMCRDGVWSYCNRVQKTLKRPSVNPLFSFLKTKDFNEAEKPQIISSLSRSDALKIVQNYVQETDLKSQEQEAKRDIKIDLVVIA